MNDRFDGVVKQLLDAGIFLEQAIEVLEKGMIQGALDRSNGNQCAAARLIGVHRNTLQRKMVEYDLAAPRGRSRRKPAGRVGFTKKKAAVIA
jgi:Fis family transcriptional regulator, factor for inversion stimulation protein